MHDYTYTKSGVYKITCIKTNKIYIGSSVNMGHRWWKHFNDVNRNGCKKLANAIKKHGAENFITEKLEEITSRDGDNRKLRDRLIEREQYYLDTLKPFDDKGYNISKVAGSNLGHKHTEEQKKKWSEMKKGKRNPMYGKTQSLESRRRSAEKRTGQKRTKKQRTKMGKHLAKPICAYDKITGNVHQIFPSQASAVRDFNAEPYFALALS